MTTQEFATATLQSAPFLNQASTDIQQANAAISTASEPSVVALPEHFTTHDLEQYLPIRRRARGEMCTNSIYSFTGYVTTHADPDGAAVFVDPDALRAKAVLNLGVDGLPGHADNLAIYSPDKTSAYNALLHITSRAHKQSDVAEFLEDWAEHLECFNDAGPINIKQATAAVRKITIDSARRVESEEQQLGASRSAFESVQASSKEPLPTTLYFKCVPYSDLVERLFVLRLGVLTGDKAPQIMLRVIKAEKHREEMAIELSSLVSEALSGDLPVLVGTYTRKN